VSAALLAQLLTDGEVRFTAKPAFDPRDRPRAAELLENAYADYRLAVAGPLLPFDAGAALDAAVLVLRACWFAVSHDEPDPAVRDALRMKPPKNAASHLSADLTLRFAAGVHRRAFGQAPDDALTLALAELLRGWPLSGVQSAVADPPTGDTEFFDHPGLQLLYAERLADHFKPAWVPAGGRTRDVTELVFQERGRVMPPVPVPPNQGDAVDPSP
jgi:hypothetical protein